MKQEARSAPRTADAVVRHIERLILEGSLRPGERLLAERELALRLQVSRPVLREGLQQLQRSGLLTSTPGAGARVAALGTSITDPLVTLLAGAPLETTADYLSFRQICEGPAARMAAEHGTPVDHDEIRRCMERINTAHEHDNAEEAEADADFHIAIYEATHNVVLLHVMRALSSMLRKGVFYSRNRLYERPEVRGLLRAQHQAIHDAIISRSADAAAAIARDHVGFVMKALHEISEAEHRLSVSLRRIGEGGTGLSRSNRPRGKEA